MIAAATVWEPLAIAAVLLAGGLTGLVGSVRWLADRSRADSEAREARFDALEDAQVEHGERLSTIEGNLNIRPRPRALRRG